MYLILIIVNVSLESETLELLSKIGINKYTKLQNLTGIGGHSEPHLNTQVWPGTNSMILVAVDKELKNQVLDKIKEFKTKHEILGVKLFALPLEEIV